VTGISKKEGSGSATVIQILGRKRTIEDHNRTELVVIGFPRLSLAKFKRSSARALANKAVLFAEYASSAEEKIRAVYVSQEARVCRTL
jgi:predicted transcriptional regulator